MQGRKKKMRPQAIPAFSPEARAKRELRQHLRELGFVRNEDGQLVAPADSKDAVRALHAVQRTDKFVAHSDFIARALPALGDYFADGAEVRPDRIRLRHELVDSGTWQADLFRLASLTWSVPVSQGYGRRMRFLVWDDFTGKLVGLLALGDPVFNLSVRDAHIGWKPDDRKKRLVNIMDAFVAGAIAPYNMLLGGKLVAAAARTTEVRDFFEKRYSQSTGIISGESKRAQLAAITTTSALGKSSVYNRLSLGKHLEYRSLGYTQGWGHFHVPDRVFMLMRQVLRVHKHRYAEGHQYGEGPNWRLRTMRAALTALGMSPNTLQHGVKREVFVCHVADNAIDLLRGTAAKADYSSLGSLLNVTSAALNRWVIPRANRSPDYRLHRARDVLDSLRRGPVVPTGELSNVACAS